MSLKAYLYIYRNNSEKIKSVDLLEPYLKLTQHSTIEFDDNAKNSC